uniref:Microtubule-associated protein RP/EB family member 1 n=1 Tax=Caenorhabditis japonica TaxID=281687 RepID=A0A8R1I3W3_CAEJA
MVVNVFISAVTTDTLSRKEAVAWVNNLLKSHFTKVEEMASGAAYCQLTHLLFGACNLRKVKFNPRNEPDILNNWKVLTTAWKELGVDKPVDVEKMKKAKFQDNMEFLQWFYKFFNANLTTDPAEYDAVAARGGEALPALKGAAAGARPAAVAPRPVAVAPRPVPVASKPAPVAKPAAQAAAVVKNGSNEALIKENEQLRAEVDQQKLLAAEWESMAKDMEAEREFYFAMLQKVEGLAHEADELKSATIDVEALKMVLYEKGEEPEQPAAEEDGALPANLDDTETF